MLLASCVAQVPTPIKTGGCIQSTNPTTHHLKSFISPTESEVGPLNHSLPAFPVLIWHGTGNVCSVRNTITSCGYTIIDINGPPPKYPRQTHHRQPFPCPRCGRYVKSLSIFSVPFCCHCFPIYYLLTTLFSSLLFPLSLTAVTSCLCFCI